MNMRPIPILALAALTSAAPVALADTYTTIDFPGAVGTDPNGINSAGVIVGDYIDHAGAAHGFQLVDGVFTAIDRLSGRNSDNADFRQRSRRRRRILPGPE